MSLLRGLSPHQCAISGREKAVTPSNLKALPWEPAAQKWSNVQWSCSHMTRSLLEYYYILLNLAASQTLHKVLVSVSDFSTRTHKIGQKSHYRILSSSRVLSDLLLYHMGEKYKDHSGRLFLLFHSCLLTKTWPHSSETRYNSHI